MSDTSYDTSHDVDIPTQEQMAARITELESQLAAVPVVPLQILMNWSEQIHVLNPIVQQAFNDVGMWLDSLEGTK